MTGLGLATAENGKVIFGFDERLVGSLEYLRFKAKSHNAIFACETVSRVVSEQHKFRLYIEMFPKEWEQSTRSLYRAGHFKAYSERTNEFFQLINDKRFPLLEYWHDDPESELERFAIPPLNFDLCCEEVDFAHLRDSYLAGLMFYFNEDDEIWNYFSEEYGVDKESLPPIKTAHANIWKETRGAKAKPFSDLIRLVDHSTGNPWLDVTNCQYPEFFEWDRETVDWLTEAYQAASLYFKNLEQLDKRIEEDAQRFFSELISFWNTGKVGSERQR
ncbi:MAG: hypothetical protein IPM50_03010 [Acidobacteriota bacterium]|nr:MAG: hypothetical protein IPM50_03010 [Acidobacteriota bacterium]